MDKLTRRSGAICPFTHIKSRAKEAVSAASGTFCKEITPPL
jgi:hypothetical protein